MEYRLLTEAEKAKVVEIHPAYAAADLSLVPIAGAVDEGGIVRGFAVANVAAHCEPMWIEARAPVDFRRLVAVVEKSVTTPLWVFAPNAKIARMAELCGAEEVKWRVFRKDL